MDKGPSRAISEIGELRILNAQYTRLDVGHDGFDTSPQGEHWDLDVLGNWAGGSGVDGSRITYTGDSTPGYDPATDTFVISDHHEVNEVNEIVSQVINDGHTPTVVDFVHDDAGSIVQDGDYTYTYDAWNRIVKVEDTGGVVATYTYDALGRRIIKTVADDGPDAEYFYYDGSRVVEHDTVSGTTQSLEAEYVYGLGYIDEPVAQYDASGTIHYILQDVNHNVIALTDGAGGVEQQYAFHPYGLYLAREDGNGNAIAPAAAAIPMGHQGLWFNPEIETYYNRARAFCAKVGSWLMRGAEDDDGGAEAVEPKVTRAGVNWADNSGRAANGNGRDADVANGERIASNDAADAERKYTGTNDRRTGPDNQCAIADGRDTD